MMRRFFQIASLALMGLMLFSAVPASAASVFYPPKAPVVAGTTNCTAICGDPVVLERQLGVLTIDPCAPRRSGPVRLEAAARLIGGENPNGLNGRRPITCGGKAQLSDCAAPLGHLPKVSEREIRSVDRHDRIKLIPICDRLNASLTQVQQNLELHGNAESLVPAIARNAVLTAALGHARYRADDVVGVTMGTDTVMLYVHKM
jgi:hypothetical protein